MVFGYRLERHELSAACIGEQDVDDTGFLTYDVIESVEVGHVGDVAPDAGRRAADRAYSGIEFRLTAARDEKTAAFACEPFRGREPDAAVRPGHDRYLAFKSSHDDFSF